MQLASVIETEKEQNKVIQQSCLALGSVHTYQLYNNSDPPLQRMHHSHTPTQGSTHMYHTSRTACSKAPAATGWMHLVPAAMQSRITFSTLTWLLQPLLSPERPAQLTVRTPAASKAMISCVSTAASRQAKREAQHEKQPRCSKLEHAGTDCKQPTINWRKAFRAKNFMHQQ